MSFKKLFCAAVWSVVLAGVSVSGVRAATITLSVNPTTDGANGLDRLLPGDTVWFQIGVAVDNSVVDNNGLATLVYDVIAQQPTPQLSGMLDAFSGFSNDGTDVPNPGVGGPAIVSDNFYNFSDNAISPDYGGGWGFNRGGLDGGGDATSDSGSIIAAGIAAPPTWTTDTHPNIPGLQPLSRPGVGIGAFTFGADDPVLPGVQGGFPVPPIPNNCQFTCPLGDGTWIIQDGHIDTADWAAGTYSFDIIPTAGAVYDGTLDYSVDIAGGFRGDVPGSDMTGTSFSFTLVPEPSTMGALFVVGLALIRRRSTR